METHKLKKRIATDYLDGGGGNKNDIFAEN